MSQTPPDVEVCIINPNSSTLITGALAAALTPLCPPGVTLGFLTGPPSSPASINDAPTSILSASTTYQHLAALSPSSDLSLHPSSGYVVACFSDHPLVSMLRHSIPSKPSLHILEASVIHALSVGTKFGVLTTGVDMVNDVDAGVRRIMGGISDRYVGTVATALGVLELKQGEKTKVESTIKDAARRVAERGADVDILGCAGMAGMESLVRAGIAEAGYRPDVAVIDGAKAGLEIAIGLARSQYRS